MESFKRIPHPMEGTTCPSCGLEFIFCEIEGCNEIAIYEGWVKAGIMIQRRHFCKEHAKLTEGYKAKGEKAFEEATKEWGKITDIFKEQLKDSSISNDGLARLGLKRKDERKNN